MDENKKKLFVGSLAYATTNEDLEAAFAQAGTVVSAQVIMERDTGRSKGFGFVEMESDEAAQAAIEMWDGQDLQGRSINVNVAKPKTDRPPRRDFGNRY